MAESELPRKGMTISLRLRRDLVITDPGRFLAAARRAYHELNPDLHEAQVAETIGDVSDAVFALLEHEDGRTLLWPDTSTPEGGQGAPLPGERVLDRPDGLSPAGLLLESSSTSVNRFRTTAVRCPTTRSPDGRSRPSTSEEHGSACVRS